MPRRYLNNVARDDFQTTQKTPPRCWFAPAVEIHVALLALLRSKIAPDRTAIITVSVGIANTERRGIQPYVGSSAGLGDNIARFAFSVSSSLSFLMTSKILVTRAGFSWGS